MILTEYPENGPYGIHVKHNSLNRKKIEKALQGHIYDEAIGHPVKTKKLEKQGWDWLCFHYEKSWKFNLKNLIEGDCLAKYFICLFAALSGVYPDLN